MQIIPKDLGNAKIRIRIILEFHLLSVGSVI